MSNIEIGTRLVKLCQEGKSLQAVEELYDEKIISLEAQGSDALPARMEGIDAVRGKNQWWFDAHEVHSEVATGPFCGHRDDQFAVKFDLDVTLKESGARSQMSEFALYTVKDGKIVQEEFLYQMG